jgi:excisionase family DNA binding protein
VTAVPQPPERRLSRGRQSPTAALFVRIPTEQAKRLDRAAFELQLPKQTLISGLLERYLDDSPESPQAPADPLTRRRVTVETLDSSGIAVGHHSFRPREPEVLTTEEVAELLQVDVQTVLELSGSGEIPARRLGGEWRFAKTAVLGWLAGGDAGAASTGGGEQER